MIRKLLAPTIGRRSVVCLSSGFRSFSLRSSSRVNCLCATNDQLLKCLNKRDLLVRHLSENQYERLVAETLESLNDYFDELLEKQNKITNYDLSLSVSANTEIDYASLMCVCVTDDLDDFH